MSAAIVFENVIKYGVVENFDLVVNKRERVLLRGGDTAILRLAAGMEKPDSGTVMLLGMEISALSDSKAAAFRNARVGYAGQDSDLFREMTLLENTALHLALRGTPRNERDGLAKEVLTILGLSPVMHNYPSTLSISQKRKAVLARSFIAEPEILLLGDLFTGLRENETAELADYINSTYVRDGFTMLICAAEVPLQLKLDREEEV